MKTIWKYMIVPGLSCMLLHPGARILSAAFQDDTLQMWVLQDVQQETPMSVPLKPLETKNIYVAFTGEAIPDDIYWQYEYVGTAVHPTKKLVAHLFEE